MRELVGLDPGDHLGVLAMVEDDVLLDLVVIAELEVAVGTLSILVHDDKLSRVWSPSSSIDASGIFT